MHDRSKPWEAKSTRFFYGDGIPQGIDEVRSPGVPEGDTVRYHGVVAGCQKVKEQQGLVLQPLLAVGQQFEGFHQHRS